MKVIEFLENRVYNISNCNKTLEIACLEKREFELCYTEIMSYTDDKKYRLTPQNMKEEVIKDSFLESERCVYF